MDNATQFLIQPCSSAHEKIFAAAVGARLLGKPINLKVRGTQREVKVVTEAISATERFQKELDRRGSTIESIAAKLALKHEAVRVFEEVIGIRFPI